LRSNGKVSIKCSFGSFPPPVRKLSADRLLVLQLCRACSGKSSLFLVLVRLLDPHPRCAENVSIDGLGLHRIHRATLRQRIIAVPQEPVFLPGGNSIRANLDPLGTASDDECLDVLRLVHLGGFVREAAAAAAATTEAATEAATEKPSIVPAAQDAAAIPVAVVGDLDAEMKAESLSSGQKQLFSLGRAILRRRVRDRRNGTSADRGGGGGGILLLDEVSSSVDRDTDRAMQDLIRREFANYTVVMVSHRLDMVVEYFDAVVILDQGTLVETGRPAELVAVEGSRFRDLWLLARH
jgi:ATP-binding cassette, subfamily C (CFTR/MRP), member 1